MGFGVEQKAAPSVINSPVAQPVQVATPAPAPAPSALNPLIMSSPQAPTASTSQLSIETSSLAAPP
jgi:hypothetical protein